MSKSIIESIPDFEERKAKYPEISELLEESYGHRVWHTDLSPMEELVSCILSQNTSDTNRDRGYAALRERYQNWQAVVAAPPEELIETIRSAGLANQKGPRIQQILKTIYERVGDYNIDLLEDMPIDEAKEWLTSLNGVGPKTAAIVLCFAFNRPAMPVDTHVYRVGQRIGFIPEHMNAEKAHDVMEAIVPPDNYYSFHIQMILHGRTICKARTPLCEECVINHLCDYYKNKR